MFLKYLHFWQSIHILGGNPQQTSSSVIPIPPPPNKLKNILLNKKDPNKSVMMQIQTQQKTEMNHEKE